MTKIKEASLPWYRNDLTILAGLALLKIMIHLPILTRYGYHADELYFIACGQHLAFGYVDHAPLVPWIAYLSTTLFGESLFALRILSTLSGAAAVFFTGLLTGRLGGGRFAQVAACAAMIIAPVYLRTGNMLCLPAFEPLFWVLGYYILVRIIQEDNPKLWPYLGLVVGIGLMNKHSMLFFGFGLAVGLLLTPLRKHFKSPYLYAAGGIVLLIFLPNLIWQINNDWLTFKFMVNLKTRVMSGISALQFLAGQLLYLHPFNAVLWISGLLFFFFSKQTGDDAAPSPEKNETKQKFFGGAGGDFSKKPPARRRQEKNNLKAKHPYRILGWLWLSVFILLVVTKSKIYYLAPAYTVLLAGGGIAVERWLRRRNKKWLKPAIITLLFLGGTAMAPLSVPLMDIDTTEKYIHKVTFGAFKNIYELTRDLRGMFGWKERLAGLAKVYHSLPAEEQQRTVIWAAGYGNAGAVDYFGGAYGLPKAVALGMNYWLWGVPEGPIDTVIGMGFKKETMEIFFNKVELAAEIELENVNPWWRKFPITLCREPKDPLPEIWKRNRPF
ncbi:MAG: glycosyltransferase family 39 protein [Candidatus Aminicenantes bacterium]|nr:glycosyltransferase family 39 protein [Candidatus Aminicenantes bacterium]